MNKTPKLMSINEIARTGLMSENTLRQLVKQNKCPGVVYIGRKALINWDRLVEMLNQSDKIQIKGKNES